MQIKNVIFDFGNVLIKWDPHNLYNKYFGDNQKADWFLKNIFTMEWNAMMDTDKTFAQVTSELTALYPQWADAIRAYDERWDEMIGGPIPEMWQLIEKLKSQGYKTYGLSNWPIEKLHPTVKLRERLDGAVISSLVQLSKPDPAIYRYLIDTYSIKPEESVFIDDMPQNIIAAEQLGFYGIIFQDYASLLPQLSDLLKTDLKP